MKTFFAAILCLATILGCSDIKVEGTQNKNDILFNDLAVSWDEGMPLGNAFVGTIVWQKGENLRMALDRIDLWDLRPTDSLSGDNFSYKWVQEQWKKGTYQNVQRKMDVPYDVLAAPSKIPGAALEFNTSHLGNVTENRIFIDDALLQIKWDGGATLKSFVHATEPVGWFEFDGVTEELVPSLLAPKYSSKDDVGHTDPVSGQDIRRLEYTQGEIKADDGVVTYHQKGWADDYYDVAVKYNYSNGKLTGVWSVTSSVSDKKEGVKTSETSTALNNVSANVEKGIGNSFRTHKDWWKNYWSRSEIDIPDERLEKHYYNEMYKFGSLTRKDSYIIPLQGVWTADNNLLPPWKGDVHHDLNTELSYWPTYTGNQCDVGMSFINTLWAQRETNRKYTKQYFGVDGINVPGVATLTGEPMGGWIQYALSPTVSSWLAQHFYLHWVYTMDEKYLADMGYPYVKDVAEFIENITIINDKGERTLPISSSPEIHDNSSSAWFPTITNYDLALMKYALQCATEMAEALGKSDEAARWRKTESEFPFYSLDENGALMFAEGTPYNESHRHFSNAMAIHPMSLLDVTRSEKERQIVEATIKTIDEIGPAYWTGYSYSWLANMKARALDGNGTRNDLKIFEECFVLRNGFHVNGDQSKTGKSTFTYRPFTLEGNFAFASAVQEMLLQSHTGVVRVFAAVPEDWKDISFKNLRARGALLVSAQKSEGKVTCVNILSEKGTTFKLQNPFDTEPKIDGAEKVTLLENGIYEISALPDSKIIITSK